MSDMTPCYHCGALPPSHTFTRPNYPRSDWRPQTLPPTLRQQYAMAALAGMANRDETWQTIAKSAWLAADAMLAAEAEK